MTARTIRHAYCVPTPWDTLPSSCRLLLTVPIRARADLRCDGGGVLQERDDLRVPLLLGVVQRRLAILPTGERGKGAEVEAAAVEGAGGGLRAARRGGAAPAQGPYPPSPPPPLAPPSPAPATRPLAPSRLPSAALCALAHLVLEARVGPRLEQRLDAGRVAVVGRPMQRRPLLLPRRGGGRTHAGGAAAAGGRVVSGGGGRGAEGAGAAAGGAALTFSVASSLAPLATRCSRQSSLP